jgi:hypothetical protein
MYFSRIIDFCVLFFVNLSLASNIALLQILLRTEKDKMLSLAGQNLKKQETGMKRNIDRSIRASAKVTRPVPESDLVSV